MIREKNFVVGWFYLYTIFGFVFNLNILTNVFCCAVKFPYLYFGFIPFKHNNHEKFVPHAKLHCRQKTVIIEEHQTVREKYDTGETKDKEIEVEETKFSEPKEVEVEEEVDFRIEEDCKIPKQKIVGHKMETKYRAVAKTRYNVPYTAIEYRMVSKPVNKTVYYTDYDYQGHPYSASRVEYTTEMVSESYNVTKYKDETYYEDEPYEERVPLYETIYVDGKKTRIVKKKQKVKKMIRDKIKVKVKKTIKEPIFDYRTISKNKTNTIVYNELDFVFALREIDDDEIPADVLQYYIRRGNANFYKIKYIYRIKNEYGEKAVIFKNNTDFITFDVLSYIYHKIFMRKDSQGIKNKTTFQYNHHINYNNDTGGIRIMLGDLFCTFFCTCVNYKDAVATMFTLIRTIIFYLFIIVLSGIYIYFKTLF